MADDASDAQTAPRAAKQSSFLIALVCLTLFGVGTGGLFGLWIANSGLGRTETVESEAHSPRSRVQQAGNVRSLPNITTNLAAPASTWVRLEASVVLDGDGGEDLLVSKIAEDLLTFLRTVSLEQIEGGSGFLHLREDLSERARSRSNGRAREVLIQAFVIE